MKRDSLKIEIRYSKDRETIAETQERCRRIEESQPEGTRALILMF